MPVPVAAAADERTARRRRRAESATAAAGTSAIHIPDSRRRWTGRVDASPNGHTAGTDTDDDHYHHDFADLAPAAEANRTPAEAGDRHGARRQRSAPPPLDAPGLDVPDPTAPAPAPARARSTAAARPPRRPRTTNPRPAKAPLPTRRKSSAGSR